jgi:hypothetical protein
MASLLRQLALVSQSASATADDLQKVSAALQKQASRDLAPVWEISATVDSFAKLEDVPLGYWPLIVMDNIGMDAAGVHEDKDGQPFALVTASAKLDEWSLTASHEMLEMLVDPFGNRLVASDSPKDGQGRVSVLVEVADPSEAADFAYTVNSILVSDFYTPNYLDPVAATGVRYSYTGAITEPRQVLRGGYLSWLDSSNNHWWQETWFDGDQPAFRDIGPLDQKAGNLRSQIDRLTERARAKAIADGREQAPAAGLTSAMAQRATTSKAAMWREQISALYGQASARSQKDKPSQVRAARRARQGD